jgi:lipopolysaccharide transport system ATP-binding protein
MSAQFEHVSKKYRLGAGTVSLREALPNAVRRLLRARISDDREHNTLWALKDVSFSLKKGQALGIVGPNGAGKTTILRLLSRITQPTSGTITIDGRVSALIELGAGFHPDLTGRENLYLNAAILGLTRREMAAKFDSIVEFAGLNDFMDTPVKRYSSGMYVRLGFSVAAHVEPDILVVDEVLAVGDASFQRKCIERILNLCRQGTTAVFVSHNMNLVRSVCERGLFLLDGQVRARGSVLSAIRAYETFLHSREGSRTASLNRTHESLELGQSIVEISGIELMNGSKQLSNHFSYTDDVQVRVSYRTQEPVRSPSLLARIIRSDGTTCCELRTRNDEVWLPDLEGSGDVTFGISPLQLASGAYVIEIRLQDTADAVPLAVSQSDWFQVSGPGVTVLYEYGGIYVPHVRWDFASQVPSIPQDGDASHAGGYQ